ncbi:MAG: 30S ribosomal protein S4e [Nanoarchaeota archaeon]
MPKQHLKRLAAPKTWLIKRKGITFSVRPRPGAHSFAMGMPLSIILRDVMGIAKTEKEVKHILQKNDIKVDGKRRKDHRFIIGLMDSIQIEKKDLMMVLNQRGKLVLIENKTPGQKLCRITGKHLVKGKIQLGFHDGNTLFTENKDIKVGDTLLVSIPDREIKEHLQLKEKAQVYLVGGSHIGDVGTIEDITGNLIVCKTKETTYMTQKRYAFIVGGEKPLLVMP